MKLRLKHLFGSPSEKTEEDHKKQTEEDHQHLPSRTPWIGSTESTDPSRPRRSADIRGKPRSRPQEVIAELKERLKHYRGKETGRPRDGRGGIAGLSMNEELVGLVERMDQKTVLEEPRGGVSVWFRYSKYIPKGSSRTSLEGMTGPSKPTHPSPTFETIRYDWSRIIGSERRVFTWTKGLRSCSTGRTSTR